MINDYIIDFDVLLKNYKDVGIYEFDNPSVHKYLISIELLILKIVLLKLKQLILM